MSTVPRLKDSVRIQRESPESFLVQLGEGGDSLPLSASGYDLLCRMDGVSDESAVREAFSARWETPLSSDELGDWIEELEGLGLFVRDSRAIAALRQLGAQGISFRGARAERRGVDRRGDRRNAAGDSRAAWFDHAVILLNDGQVKQSANLFARFAEEDPGDVRVAELARHLRGIAANDLPPQGERRDLTWAVFDDALRVFLDAGACPACGGEIDIEIGDLNRCYDCGAAFSGFVLDASRNERRER